jgi:CspA family cold shock protein
VSERWLEALASADPETRREAAWNLGRLGDRRVTPALLEALGRAEAEEDRGFGEVICRALGQLGDKRALPRLIEVVSGGSAVGARNALEALGLLGDPDAAPALIRALSRPQDRVIAGVALGRLGEPGCSYGTVRPLREGMRWGLVQPLVGGRERGRPVFFQFGDWDSALPPREDLLVSYYVIEVRGKTRAVRVRPVERAEAPAQVQAAPELAEGTVRWFDTARGFGFLETDSGQRVFVHYHDVRSQRRHRSLSAGQRVRFRLATSERGARAVDVRPLTEDPAGS